jgi:hypothetical protein
MQIASHWQAFARYLAAPEISKRRQGCCLRRKYRPPGKQTGRAGTTRASDIPIGIIVGVAIIGIAVGVLSSAQ